MKLRMLLVPLVLLILAGCDSDAAGPPGNASLVAVTVSFHFDEAVYNGPVASMQYAVPEITPSVVDGGAVLLYFRDQGTWTALPYTLGVESDSLPAVDYTFTIGYAHDSGFLEIFVEASTDDAAVWDDLTGILPPTYVMKVVIIDGYAASLRQEVDVRDLEAVRGYFGIRE